MGHWNLLHAYRISLACGDIVNGVQYIGRVVAIATRIAHANDDIFHNHEALLVFEGLTLDSSRLDRAAAVGTWIAVHHLPSSTPLMAYIVTIKYRIPYRIRGLHLAPCDFPSPFCLVNPFSSCQGYDPFATATRPGFALLDLKAKGFSCCRFHGCFALIAHEKQDQDANDVRAAQ
jgi:hypothetical protein